MTGSTEISIDFLAINSIAHPNGRAKTVRSHINVPSGNLFGCGDLTEIERTVRRQCWADVNTSIKPPAKVALTKPDIVDTSILVD